MKRRSFLVNLLPATVVGKDLPDTTIKEPPKVVSELPNSDGWHHLTITRISGEVKVYINQPSVNHYASKEGV